MDFWTTLGWVDRTDWEVREGKEGDKVRVTEGTTRNVYGLCTGGVPET